MYAIIEVGGKQYSVKKDDEIQVEKFSPLSEKGVSLDKVLMVSDGKEIHVGQPYLKGASVSAAVLGEAKGPKSVAFKYRRRKSSHWNKGHRQGLVCLKIKEINIT